jgi:hypothetical protein
MRPSWLLGSKSGVKTTYISNLKTVSGKLDMKKENSTGSAD